MVEESPEYDRPWEATPVSDPINPSDFVTDKQILDDLYEQCSDHIEEKIPTSVGLGVRSKMFKISLYSSDERPCCKARVSDLSGLLPLMISARQYFEIDHIHRTLQVRDRSHFRDEA